MDKFDRIFHLHAILAARQTPISLEDLMARLECSKATLYRAIAVLKDTLHAPVVFDTGVSGFRYARTSGEDAFELPGLWFTSGELQAFALMQRLLKDLSGGLLTELGPATYVKHESELPMAITWRLHHPLPGDLFAAFAAAVA